VTRDQLRALTGATSVLAAPVLTWLVLRHVLPSGGHEAAVVLCTLAWQQAATVIRSLFPGPEIDVHPPKEPRQ
jgi:hypothetical protein